MSLHDDDTARTDDTIHLEETARLEDTTHLDAAQPAQHAVAAQSTAFSPTPVYKTGPAPVTSLFGLFGLLTAIAVLITQATDLDIHWDVVGPVAVVGIGAFLVVLGTAGLRGQRFRG